MALWSLRPFRKYFRTSFEWHQLFTSLCVLFWSWTSCNCLIPLLGLYNVEESGVNRRESMGVIAYPSGRAVWGVWLRPLACWDYGFESRQGYGRLSLVSVVCCQVEVSASGWSLFQRSPSKCDVSEFDHESSIMWRPWTNGGCSVMVKKIGVINFFFITTMLWLPVSQNALNYATSSCHSCHIRLLQTQIFHLKFKEQKQAFLNQFRSWEVKQLLCQLHRNIYVTNILVYEIQIYVGLVHQILFIIN